ncbi:hypothetical protein DJ564_08285 [Pseudomonas sp. 31-12]|nr:hypothetical protein DJ564_08285 [Pseudomonas sp. 31-12]
MGRLNNHPWHTTIPVGAGLWRGDLSPFGCEAVVNPLLAVYLIHRSVRFGAASQPNGDKSPHHTSPLPQRIVLWRRYLIFKYRYGLSDLRPPALARLIGS